MSKGFTAVDLATCAKYLKMVEEHGLRRPKPTYVATRLLLDNPARAKLTKRDQYARMETHAVAALDLGDVESARRVVSSLRNVFPESLRLDRLEAMCLEAQGDHDAALKAYDAILERSPAEQRAMKRRASCLRAAGRPEAAVDALVEYLDTFMADVDAWEALAGLYTELRMYQQAVFCWEEVLVAQPQIPHHHRRMAETLVTWGGEPRLRDARRYYAAALDMSGATDVRAMYGLVLVDKRLKAVVGKRGKGKGAEEEDGDLGSNLGEDAAAFLPRFYASAAPELKPVVERQLGVRG